ncbi:MAG: S8 family serine peptidase [Ruminococcaceae bacterium]|nr:S8 family serine peptidase [Oscillospiraceae bacterium]
MKRKALYKPFSALLALMLCGGLLLGALPAAAAGTPADSAVGASDSLPGADDSVPASGTDMDTSGGDATEAPPVEVPASEDPPAASSDAAPAVSTEEEPAVSTEEEPAMAPEETADASNTEDASISDTDPEPAPEPAAGPAADESEPGAALMAEDPDAGVLYAEGEVLVQFRDGATPQEAAAALEDCSALPAEALTAQALGSGALLMEVADGASVALVAQALNNHPAVEMAQPNYMYFLPVDGTRLPADDPTDTGEDDGSGLLTTSVNDKYASLQWHLKAINLLNAWDFQRTDGAVRVAVIDTGIDLTHPDLVNNIESSFAWDAVKGAKLTGDVDGFGHGTHVAGIIAAQTNNKLGVAGVSYNAKIVPINVFKSVTGGVVAYTSTIISAIDYVIAVPNVKVMNFSLGGSVYDQLYHQAIQRATKAGIVCVAAAGNENTAAKVYPSDFDECISVTALTEAGTRASYSNYNEYKDIAAPGSLILSTEKGGAYVYMSGTSMATPVVSGVVALLFAQTPSLNVDAVKEILYNTADDLGATGRDNYYGYGRINAYDALRYNLKTSPINVELDITARTIGIGESFTLTATVMPSFAQNPNVGWSTDNPAVATVNGGVVTGTGAGTAVITATTEDGGLTASCTVICMDNSPLAAVEMNLEAKTLKKGGKVTLKATLEPMGTGLSGLTWKSSKPKVATVSKTGQVKALKNGKTTITATTEDGTLKASCVITVGTPLNSLKISSKTLKMGKGNSTTLKAAVSPAKASNKKVTWVSSNPDIATVSAKGVVTAVGYGTATITATAQDGGKTVKCTVTVGQRVTRITLNKNTAKLGVKKSLTLKATITPDDALNQKVIWKSANTKIATVSSKGKVKALKKGTVIITATTEDGALRARCKITIK